MAGVRTELLGQFLEDNADLIIERLEAAGITWWVKRSGNLARTLFADSWGVRIFVDVAHLAEARDIARDVVGA